MKDFLLAQGFDVWESMITESTMEKKSKEYNEISIKYILCGFPYPIKAKVDKCSSTKFMWDKLQDLHSKGVLIMTCNQEDNEK